MDQILAHVISYTQRLQFIQVKSWTLESDSNTNRQNAAWQFLRK